MFHDQIENLLGLNLVHRTSIVMLTLISPTGRCCQCWCSRLGARWVRQHVSQCRGQIPGETKQADGFSFTQVYLAGHASVFNQPEATLRIQHRAITGMDIASGMVPMVPG